MRLFSLFLPIVVLLSSGCSQRNAPPASFSYGTGTPVNKKFAQTIIVKKGETLESIALRYGVSKEEIIKRNSLSSPYKLWPGQLLYLIPSQKQGKPLNSQHKNPMVRKEWHDIEIQPLSPLEQTPAPSEASQKTSFKESSGSLSQKGKLETRKENSIKLSSKKPLKLEEKFAQKEEAILEELAKAKKDPLSSFKEKSHSEKNIEPQEEIEKESKPLEEETVPSSSSKNEEAFAQTGKAFSWPLSIPGEIILLYGQRDGTSKNDGINIEAPLGTPVLAVEDGSVVYSGNELKGFGNLILLRHKNGWMSAYGHLSQIFIRQGEHVQKGQKIATLGQTGQVSSPQLHLEIRQGTKAVDPLSMLQQP